MYIYVCIYVYTHTHICISRVCVYSYLLSCVRLFATPWTVTRQAPLSMGILQERILEWVAMSSSRESSQPRDQTQVSHIAGRSFTICATQGSPWMLEWVAYSFSRGSFWPRNWTGVSCKAGRFFTSWATRETQISCTYPKWLKADAKQRLVYKCS